MDTSTGLGHFSGTYNFICCIQTAKVLVTNIRMAHILTTEFLKHSFWKHKEPWASGSLLP